MPRGIVGLARRVHLDEEQLENDVTGQMSDGIDHSRLVICFITSSYMDKVAGNGPRGLDDACKNEFDYAIRRFGAAKVIPVVMEAECKDTSTWTGAVGFKLGGHIHFDMSSDDAPEDVRKLGQLSTFIKRRLDTGRVFRRTNTSGKIMASQTRMSRFGGGASSSTGSMWPAAAPTMGGPTQRV